MSLEIKVPKKLIEVALPLDDINREAAKEKSIRHGHPSTLHLWWARRPLAATRAVLFAQLVNDPGYERHLGRGVKTEQAQKERERLFGIIRRLVKWENLNNKNVLDEARDEIWKSWRETCLLNKSHPDAGDLFNPDKLPSFHDPFAGGGAIPLEASRLGLEAFSSDLNPIAVLINKAMIEIPARFKDCPPVSQSSPILNPPTSWFGTLGIAEDIKYFGAMLRDHVLKKVGHQYSDIRVTEEMVVGRPDLRELLGKEIRPIAYLWARTVKSPNPAFAHVEVPLIATYILSTSGEQSIYVVPRVEGDHYQFEIRRGTPPPGASDGTKMARGANFRCLVSGSPIASKYIYSEANAGRMGTRLIAVVAEGMRGRVYLPPSKEIEESILSVSPIWKPDVNMSDNPRWFSPPLYGLKSFGDLYTNRQLNVLPAFADGIAEIRQEVFKKASAAGFSDDLRSLEDGGIGAHAYADAIAVYLSLGVDKLTDYNSTLVSWSQSRDQAAHVFTKQAVPMVWDYCEVNPFAGAAGDIQITLRGISNAVTKLPSTEGGLSCQQDAQKQEISKNKVVSTDPPYYANIGYADLSDYFYVWLRRSLLHLMPKLFSTVVSPKAEELVAIPHRHGSKELAESFFLNGMTTAMATIADQAHVGFPITIYYSFKQKEKKGDEAAAITGWETFLEAVLRSGLSITGTWPIRTERQSRSVGQGTNALASSIVLVCRKRSVSAQSISRREFIRELNAQLPVALDEIIHGGDNLPLAPVDLSQAIIGPGMAIFSKYAAVLEADGSPMSVRTALHLINRFFSEDDFDPDSQFCIHWFETSGWDAGKYGEAEVLTKAKGTSVEGLKQGGVVESFGGKVRLLRWNEFPTDWKPEVDKRISIWEILHQLIRMFRTNGEKEAGKLLAKTHRYAEPVRSLAYRLYTICEHHGRAQDAGVYNEFVQAWESIDRAAQQIGYSGQQMSLFNEDGDPNT